MKEKIFDGKFEKLRSEERLRMIEVDRVVELSLHGIEVSSLLDIGTGTGVFAEAFGKFVDTIHGIDLNPDILEFAKKYLPKGNFQVAFAEDLPFEDDQFDVVFFGHVLHESSEKLKALGEAKRCAQKRVAVFEWPMVDKDGKVATGRRVSPDEMKVLSDELGFHSFEQINLTTMILYILEV